MNLYSDNGYANMASMMASDTPIIFIVGGRGTGKTYGALQEILRTKEKFIFMRRTQSQCDMVSKKEFSPFRPLLLDNPALHMTSKPVSKYNAAFYMTDEEDNITGDPIGYTCALSTISNLRGFDASDVKILLYDEFIPERHERPLKNEGDALLNAYETINRNREIKGQKPLKLVCMANANDLACPVFAALGLVDVVDKMARKKKTIYQDRNRGISIFMLRDSPISTAKRKTALYKLTEGSKFSQMALDNAFSGEDYSNIKVRPIQEYRPLVVFSDVCVYEHKSKQEYYCVRHITGSPPVYSDSELDKKAFKNNYGWLYFAILNHKVLFADYYCKIALTNVYS